MGRYFPTLGELPPNPCFLEKGSTRDEGFASSCRSVTWPILCSTVFATHCICSACSGSFKPNAEMVSGAREEQKWVFTAAQTTSAISAAYSAALHAKLEPNSGSSVASPPGTGSTQGNFCSIKGHSCPRSLSALVWSSTLWGSCARGGKRSIRRNSE